MAANYLETISAQLAETILSKAQASTSKPFFVFIGGGRATGKSTLAAMVQKQLPKSVVISEDYYILSPEKLKKLQLHIEEPMARDSALLCSQIASLREGEVIRIPVEGPLASVPGQIYIDPDHYPIIIIEGIGVFEPMYDGLRDYSIFMECSEDLAEKRFIDRCLLNPERNPYTSDPDFPASYDAGSLAQYFRSFVLPLYYQYFVNGAAKADQTILNETSGYETLVKIEFPNGRRFFMKPPTPEDLTVRKGSTSKLSYGDLFFGGIFQASESLSPSEFASKYSHLLKIDSALNEDQIFQNILDQFFDTPDALNFLKKSAEKMPYLWKSQPDIRRGFKWADSAIKLTVERMSPDDTIEKFRQTSQLISDLIKIQSRTFGLYVFDTMDVPTFMRLLNIPASIVCDLPIAYSSQDDDGLMLRNNAALRACEMLDLTGIIDARDKDSLKDLLKFSAYAGVTFPSEASMKSQDLDAAEKEISRILQVAMNGSIAVDYCDRLIDILLRSTEVTVVLDDNGECVADLLFIQNIASANPDCRFNFLVNKNQVGVNLRADMLQILLDYPQFSYLKRAFDDERCLIITEDSVSESLSYELLSDFGRSAVERSDITYVKGQLFFETFNNISRYTAYVFVPSSSTAIAYCGRARGAVVYVCEKNETRIEVDGYGAVTKTLG